MSSTDPTPGIIGKARTCNIDAFIDEFAKQTQEMDNKRYCFLLGAGASKSSGISLGSELAMEWLKEIHREEASPGESLEDWATAENLGISGFTLEQAASSYTHIFERRFDGRMDDGQFWLEKKFGTALPSTGYYFLAQILGGSKHKVVITTNFDNLPADAVLQLTGNLPRIISDARIARFLSPQPRLPIIAKIHGDIGFATINTTDGISQLAKEWKDPIRRILELYVPIVIGWEGNDGSLMDFLTEEMTNEHGESLLPAGIFWCYRGERSWQERLAQNPKLAALARVHTIRFIQIDGFDEFMLRMARSLSEGNPLEKLQSQQKRRLNVFADKLRDELKQDNNALAANSELLPKRELDFGALDLMLKVNDALNDLDSTKRIKRLRGLVHSYPGSAELTGLLARELRRHKGNDDETESLYQRAIKADPGNAENLGNYANFLATQRNDRAKAAEYYEKAIAATPNHASNLGGYAYLLGSWSKDFNKADEYYQKAIAADPSNAVNLGNYADFLITYRGDTIRADEYYQKAIAASPRHAGILGGYAHFLETRRKDDVRAAEYYKKAIAADVRDTTNLGTYAHFLATRGKDVAEVESHYKKAIAAAPNNAPNLANYASYLTNWRKDDARAEEYYQKALAADPSHATILAIYASFLMKERKDDAGAEEYYQKSLAADPNNAGTLSGYASFLWFRRKDDVGAEEYYQKAIAADPNNADILGSHALFLMNQCKDDARTEEAFQKALAAAPYHAMVIGNYAEFILTHSRGDTTTQFARFAQNKSLRYPENVYLAVAILWMSAVVAERDGKPNDVLVGALKSAVNTSGYYSDFQYGDLTVWVEENIRPPDAAAFWISAALTCEGTERPGSLEQFPRWRDARIVPIDEGLNTVVSLFDPGTVWPSRPDESL